MQWQQCAPNLFVIGASKSGSSALHAYLGAHPQIHMGTEKEPCFFVDQAELEEAWPIMSRQPCSHDWEAYLELFAGGEQVQYRGEGSVYYSQAPHRSGVAERIARYCPDARIIYTLRDPVDRAIAHYWQRYKLFQEKLPIDQAMRANAIYRDSSDYALQLAEYYRYFEPSQVTIVIAEELRQNRRAVLAELFQWLGLEAYHHTADELADRHVSPSTSRKERFPMVRAIRDSAAWALLRRALPKNWVDRLRDASTTSFERTEVDESGTRAYLHRYLDPRRQALEELIGRPIPQWSREAG